MKTGVLDCTRFCVYFVMMALYKCIAVDTVAIFRRGMGDYKGVYPP